MYEDIQRIYKSITGLCTDFNERDYFNPVNGHCESHSPADYLEGLAREGKKGFDSFDGLYA
jgi:hypothetical protein